MSGAVRLLVTTVLLVLSVSPGGALAQDDVDAPDCRRDPAGELSARPGDTLRVTITCTDPGGARMTAVMDAKPDYGTATLGDGGANGVFVVTYIPPATGREGDSDYVSLQVSGSASYPAYLSFGITLILPPPPPRCYEPEQFYVPAGDDLTVAAECSNDDDTQPAIELVAPPAHGSLKPAGPGTWTYRSARGFRGIDQFTYRASNANGATDPIVQRIEVGAPVPSYLRPSRVDYCVPRRAGEQCGPGYGRRTVGGGEKVSHRHWPRISGILWKVYDSADHAKTGGPRTDELLGHHGSDRLAGGGGADVLWGDWDPQGNTPTQSDVLSGGAGDDFIYSSHGANAITGGAGDDHIWAFYGHGTIDCGPGNDIVRLRGGSKAYKLRGCERRGSF